MCVCLSVCVCVWYYLCLLSVWYFFKCVCVHVSLKPLRYASSHNGNGRLFSCSFFLLNHPNRDDLHLDIIGILMNPLMLYQQASLDMFIVIEQQKIIKIIL